METNTLYQNIENGNFTDMTHAFNLNQNHQLALQFFSAADPDDLAGLAGALNICFQCQRIV